MHNINAFQRDCLYAIGSLRRPQGTEIKGVLDEYYPAPVNYARLYPALDSLVTDGYIEKTKKDGRTNEYTLTDMGWDVLKSRRNWERECLGDSIPEPAITEATS